MNLEALMLRSTKPVEFATNQYDFQAARIWEE